MGIAAQGRERVKTIFSLACIKACKFTYEEIHYASVSMRVLG